MAWFLPCRANTPDLWFLPARRAHVAPSPSHGRGLGGEDHSTNRRRDEKPLILDILGSGAICGRYYKLAALAGQLERLDEVGRQGVEGLAVVLLQLAGVAEQRDIGVYGHLC